MRRILKWVLWGTALSFLPFVYLYLEPLFFVFKAAVFSGPRSLPPEMLAVFTRDAVSSEAANAYVDQMTWGNYLPFIISSLNDAFVQAVYSLLFVGLGLAVERKKPRPNLPKILLALSFTAGFALIANTWILKWEFRQFEFYFDRARIYTSPPTHINGLYYILFYGLFPLGIYLAHRHCNSNRELKERALKLEPKRGDIQ